MFTEVSKKAGIISFIGVLIGSILCSIDTSIVTTAVPKIVASLGGMEYVSWVFTAYLLASMVAIPVFGKLADMYGRKRFFLFGVVLFLIGSALSGTSVKMSELILFRAIQGIGAGIISICSTAIVADIFPPAERGKYQGALASVMAVASLIGPALGGFITDHFSWRWVFYVNLPLGALAVVVLWFSIPAAENDKTQRNIDFAGISFVVASFVPLLLAFSWAGTKYAWSSGEIIGLFVFSAMAILVLIFTESKAKDPIIPLKLFKRLDFNIPVITGFLFAGVIFGVIMYIPLYVQGVLGRTSSGSGIITTPLMLGLLVSAILGGQIISRTKKFKLTYIAGLALTLAGTILMTFMNSTTTTGYVVTSVGILGLGAGLCFTGGVIAIQNTFPQSQVGTVTASLQFFRSLGSIIGVAILGSAMNIRFQAETAAIVTESVKKTLPPNLLGIINKPEVLFDSQQIGNIKAALSPDSLAVFLKLFDDLKNAFSSSMHILFVISALIVLVALILALFLKEVPAESNPTVDRFE